MQKFLRALNVGPAKIDPGHAAADGRVTLPRFDYDCQRHICGVVDAIMKNRDTRLPFLALAKQARPDLMIVEVEARSR